MQKNLLSIINLVILYLQINFILFVPAPVCCAKYPVWRLFFVQKRQLLFRNTSKGLQHPQNMKIKNSTSKELLYVTKYPIQQSQMYFYLIVLTAICQIPFTAPNCFQERQLWAWIHQKCLWHPWQSKIKNSTWKDLFSTAK